MDNKLRLTRRELADTRLDRQTSQRASEIQSEVFLAMLMAEGAIALGERIMHRLREMDETRMDQAGDSPVRNLMMGRITGKAGQIAEQQLDGLYNRFKP